MGTLKVNGNISATGTISATSFLGHASSATVARFLSSHDTRNDSIEPNQMKANEAVQFDFKADSTINLTDAPYSGVMSYRPYSTSSDWTGGPAHQLAFNSAGLYWRQSSGNTWLGWNKLIHSGNYTDYTVTKTGSGASGTWGINITGNATYATSASRLYSTDNSYKYGSANPYYGYLTYSDPYWDFKVSPATPADVRVSRAYTAGSADSANWASGASYAERVAGYYTGNGGAQGPSYIGRGNVKFNMMNQFPNAGTTNYMDCILMNTYGGGDVPRATAFGIERYSGRAWIAEGSDTSSTWEHVYEVISTRNIASQSVNYANTAGWASSAGDAGTLNGWYASGFIKKHGWWTNGDTSHHADTTEDGIVFAYTGHGVPSNWGTLCTFGYGNGRDYNLQLHGTGNNQLFFRNRSSDYGQGSWQRVQVVTGWGSTNPNSAGIRGTNTGDVYYVY